MSLVHNDAYNQAVAQCTSINAKPVIIHNDEQQAYWLDRRNELGVNLILGMRCNTTSNRVEWSDGSPVDYEPLNGIDYETQCSSPTPFCVWEMYTDGHWHVAGCDTGKEDFNIFCTAQLEQPAHSGDGCDAFEDDSEDGVCYQIGSTVENWQDAQKTCLNFGADLASIHSDQENSFVRRLAVSKGVRNGLFLGATSSGKGNDFGWIDGTEWDYSNFYAGFPVSGLGNCVAMDTVSSTSGEWVNTDCSTSFSVACVRKPKDHICTNGPWQEGQVITSPGFPFEASIPCFFMFSVDVKKRVELEITFLEANSCCDNLVIYEDYIGDNIIANLTGEISDKVYKTKSSNFMRVSWNPNGGVNVKGLMMTYRAV